MRVQHPLHFGHIPGIPEGTLFGSRLALLQAGVHGQLQAGISGRMAEGANAILVNPAYEDNLDLGHTLFYAGQGGRSRQTGHQVADQHLAGHTKALWLSMQQELPVRVIRQIDTPAGPQYRYDGLYKIVDCQRTTGISGHQIFLFKFTYIIQLQA